MNPQSKFPFPVEMHGEMPSTLLEVKAGEAKWFVPEEMPVAFVYNRRNYAVMMATPQDLPEFAVGFSLTEGVIKDLSEVRSLDIRMSGRGADLRFKLHDDALERLELNQRRRNMVGSASCGLCGLENVDTLFKKLPRVSECGVTLREQVMVKAMKNLSAAQPLNLQTRSVHAAAWVDHAGGIELVREDVGRHNALDKLLGVLAIEKTDVRAGFILMSSRCSYEIVEKAARRGVQAILSISGPTAFALRKAQEANMAIYSRLGDTAVRLL